MNRAEIERHPSDVYMVVGLSVPRLVADCIPLHAQYLLFMF